MVSYIAQPMRNVALTGQTPPTCRRQLKPRLKRKCRWHKHRPKLKLSVIPIPM